MTRDTLSLLLVNGASALLLGVSFTLAVDVIPWLRRRPHQWVLVGMLVVWGALILGAETLSRPYELQARRAVGAAVSLWVVYLLLRYIRVQREESEVK